MNRKVIPFEKIHPDLQRKMIAKWKTYKSARDYYNTNPMHYGQESHPFDKEFPLDTEPLDDSDPHTGMSF